MGTPSIKELKESIKELSAYRNRLREEVISAGQKLRLSKTKIESTLKDHSELKEIELLLYTLQKEVDLKTSQDID